MKKKAKASGGAAIYHVVRAHEGFDVAAGMLFELVREAQEVAPGEDRHLYLDIEGHRNAKGGFDAGMVELQQEFALGFLGQYLSAIHAPLVSVVNPKPQNNDVPPSLQIQQSAEGKK